MKLLTPDHPDWLKLYQPAQPVTDIKTQVTPHINRLAKLMHNPRKGATGVGLAAPQVGIFYRFFVFGIGLRLDVINPSILQQNDILKEDYEGCLSFPGRKIIVKRPTEIMVEYTTSKGEVVNKCFKDLYARIFLHEFDHLNGVCIVPKP